MKNNFSNLNIFIILIIFTFFCNANLFSKEVNLKAKEVLSFENGNIIVGKKEVEAKIDKELEIFADKITYNKITEQIIAEKNVIAKDLINSTEISAEKMIFFKKKNQIITEGKTLYSLSNEYRGQSSDVSFYINEKIIFSNSLSIFKDNFDNVIEASSFRYSNNTQILKAKEIKIFDKDQNKYFLNKGFINLSKNILLGKDVKINLRNDTFGIPENQPKLN